MIGTLLIANRGEIVARIARTARAMGIRTVAVYSDPDRDHAALASVDLAVHLPGATAADTYLDAAAVLAAADAAGADAVHPGFGFLAENPGFAAAVIESGRTWVGPDPEHIAVMGDKVAALASARAAGVPVLDAGPVVAATEIGFPLIVKAAAGGGGKGMRIAGTAADLDAAVTAAAGEAERSFGDGSVYVERLVTPARHVEVQVFGDRHGDLVHLFERECSIQRRHQKIIEEAPSPGIDAVQREELCHAAVRLAAHIGYVGAGTVEFVVGEGGFWFIEMNTRLQVEHPVTEEVTGTDLVEWQLRVASGDHLPMTQDEIVVSGHAIEARLYAEDPGHDWAPGVGVIERYEPGPGGARYESAIATGSVVTTHYDPMLAKVITHRESRAEAAAVLAAELAAIVLHGPPTNRDFLVGALRSPAFRSGATFTSFVEDHRNIGAAANRDAHLAAALWERTRRNRAADRHWGFAPPGWRNLPSQRQFLSLDGTPIRYALGAERIDIEVAGRGVAARVTGANPYLVEIDGVAVRCTVSGDGSTWWVNSSDGQSRFVEDPRFVVHDTAISGGGPTAPVPGTVVAVLVEAGDEVDEYTDLLVMEAMKMEHRVKAPTASVVREVMVAAGDQVDAGMLLVKLEEAEA